MHLESSRGSPFTVSYGLSFDFLRVNLPLEFAALLLQCLSIHNAWQHTIFDACLLRRVEVITADESVISNLCSYLSQMQNPSRWNACVCNTITGDTRNRVFDQRTLLCCSSIFACHRHSSGFHSCFSCRCGHSLAAHWTPSIGKAVLTARPIYVPTCRRHRRRRIGH